MRDQVIIVSMDGSFGDLNNYNFGNIKNRFIAQGRYSLLLGNRDFAKSFLTSEWLFKKYFSLEEMDNTFIVAGYLKSIEQLLWDIIYLIGQGRQIRGGTVEEDNGNAIDTTLGSLQRFITNYDNADLFEAAFDTGPHFEYFINFLLTLGRKCGSIDFAIKYFSKLML